MNIWLSKRLFFLILLICVLSSVGAMEFLYNYNTGDKYRIIATVNEDIFVDRRLSYRAEILTRISMEVTGVSGEKANLRASFQSAEKTAAVGVGGRIAEASHFLWAKDYESEYEQDKFGYMTIEDHFFMPMVRNVPVFPGRELEIGESWISNGVEVYDFRDNYGIEKPYRIPFTARYTYLGEKTWKENTYPAFSISYRVLLHPDAVPGKVYPRRIEEASDQIVYWDAGYGQAAAYEDHFRIIIDLSDGQTWEYRGRSEAEVVEAPPMNKEELVKEIAEELTGIPDATVRLSDEGIVISLENIQFTADSAVLARSEWSKVDKIIEILMKYPERDILVGGHAALAGNAAGRLQLSLERAQTVANYIIDKKVREPGRVVVRGYGAERPVADNRTAEGMQKNRRVEIIILEN